MHLDSAVFLHEFVNKIQIVQNRVNEIQQKNNLSSSESRIRNTDKKSLSSLFYNELLKTFKSESFLVLSLDRKILYASPIWLEKLGYQMSEIAGYNFDKFIHHLDKYSMKSSLYELRKSENLIYFTNYRIIKDSGDFIEQNGFCYLIRNKEEETSIICFPDKFNDFRLTGEWLQNNHYILSEIYDISPSGIILADNNLKIIYSNNTARNFLQQVSGQPEVSHLNIFSSLCDYEGNPFSPETHPVDIAFQSQKGFRNSKFSFKDNVAQEKKYITANIYPIPDKTGEIVSILIGFNDITQIAAAEHDSIKSAERLQHTLESSSDGLWDWNPNTGKFFYNLNFYEILDYEPYEIPPDFDLWADLLHPDDQSLAVKQVKNHIEKKNSHFEFDARLRCKSGNWKWVSIYGKAVKRYPDDNPMRLVGSIYDITARKKTEDELLKNVDKWKQLFNASVEPIMVCTKDGRINEANEAAILKFGYSHEELQQLSFFHICGYISVEIREKIENQMFINKTAEFDVEIITRDGKRIPCEVKMQARFLGTDYMEIITLKDMSAIQKLKNECRDLKQELEEIKQRLEHQQDDRALQ